MLARKLRRRVIRPGIVINNYDAWSALIGELRQHVEEKVSPQDVIVQIAPRNRAAAPGDLANPMERAWLFMRERREQEALEAALTTSATDPFYYKALTLIAEVRTNQGDFADAEEAIDEAVALAPKHPEAYVRRAWLRYHQGRFADGLSQLDMAEHRMNRLGKVEDFLTTELPLARGTLLYHQGDGQRAIEELDRYLELKPDDNDARNLRAGAQLQLSRQ